MSLDISSTNITTVSIGTIPSISSISHHKESGCLFTNATTMSTLHSPVIITSLITLVVGVVGNLFVLLTFISRWRQLNIYELLLLNLVIVDVVGCVVLPANVIYTNVDFTSYSVMGQPCCQLMHFLTFTSVSVASLTLVSSAIHRFVVTRYPLSPQLAKKHLIPISMGIWLMGCLPGIPYLVNVEKEKYVIREICERSSVVKCTPLIWTQFRDSSVVVAFIMQVLIPLLAMAVTHVLIVYEFHETLNTDIKYITTTRVTQTLIVPDVNQSGRQPRQRRMSVIAMNQMKNRQATKLLIVLDSLFLVCVTPANLYYFYQLLTQSRSSPSNNAVLAFTLLLILQMINPCLHPFIYAKFHSPFRSASVKILTFPYKYFAHLLAIYRGKKMLHYHYDSSQLLYLSQNFRNGDGYNIRKSSRASSGGRTYSSAQQLLMMSENIPEL